MAHLNPFRYNPDGSIDNTSKLDYMYRTSYEEAMIDRYFHLNITVSHISSYDNSIYGEPDLIINNLAYNIQYLMNNARGLFPDKQNKEKEFRNFLIRKLQQIKSIEYFLEDAGMRYYKEFYKYLCGIEGYEKFEYYYKRELMDLNLEV